MPDEFTKEFKEEFSELVGSIATAVVELFWAARMMPYSMDITPGDLRSLVKARVKEVTMDALEFFEDYD